MRILITGVHGFVGSNLVKSLSEDHQLYGLDIVSPPKDGLIKTFMWSDIKQIPAVDVIIHLAGIAHDTKKKTESEVYFRINTGLTQTIYDYFLESTARVFIFFSTAKAAADTLNGVLTEDVIPNPIGPYGESKIEAERYVLSNCVDGKVVYILRPCMIHGPGNKGNLNLLYNVVKHGLPWPLGAFDNRRSFTSIANLQYLVSRLVDGQIESGIYNVCDDESLSTNELVSIICDVIGKRCYIWKVPRFLIKSIATIGGWLHLPLDNDRLSKLTENYVSSNCKIKQALTIEKMPIDARQGFRDTITYFHNTNQ